MFKKCYFKSVVICFLGLVSCQLNFDKRSTIQINNQCLKTRKINASFVNGIPSIKLGNKMGQKTFGFSFSFNTTFFPKEGSFECTKGSLRIGDVATTLTIDNQLYYTNNRSGSYIEASAYKGKSKFYLHPTWYFSQIPDPTNSFYIKGGDSVLVSGTFYEPDDITIR